MRDAFRESTHGRDLMFRRDFVEFLIRRSSEDAKGHAFVDDALQALKKQIYQAIPSEDQAIKLFRERFVWTLPVHVLFKDNFDKIQRVLHKYGDNLTFSTIQKILMIDSRPPLTSNLSILQQACVYSKMTAIKDEDPKAAVFNKPEFFETIARVVDLESKGTSNEYVFLHHKLELTLD